MHTILSFSLAINALSAGALATSASIDGRSGGFGTIGQDANLTIRLWDSEDCMPTYDYNNTLKLSWGVMQLTNSAAQSFRPSRGLRDTENLQWSIAAQNPLSVKRAGLEHVIPGCEHYVKPTNLDPIGNPLEENLCVPLGMVMNCVNLYDDSDQPIFD